jgi:hypothetical protein
MKEFQVGTALAAPRVRQDPLLWLGSGITKERAEKKVFAPELVNQCEYSHSLERLMLKAM